MATALRLHGRTVRSIFELLGTRENDITYSIGWALAKSPSLRRALLEHVFGEAPSIDHVRLQHRGRDGGITDIELDGDRAFAIVEAKRGMTVPGERQLDMYATRLKRTGRRAQALVSLSDCSNKFACTRLPAEVRGVRVVHVPYAEVVRMARRAPAPPSERAILRELQMYLERIIRPQDLRSNMVYVVALGSGKPESADLTWRDIVDKRGRYFHPVGVRGWPKEPPNYLAFRYKGRLQSIRHVEGAEVVTDIAKEMPEFKRRKPWREPHFLYRLGRAIEPPREVRTGNIYANGRVWAAIDLLLTSSTIAKARDRTKKRLKERD